MSESSEDEREFENYVLWVNANFFVIGEIVLLFILNKMFFLPKKLSSP